MERPGLFSYKTNEKEWIKNTHEWMNNKRKVLAACRWWWWTDDLETLCSGNGYGLPDVIWERWQFTIAVLIWFYLISNTCWFQKHTYRYIPHTHTHMGNLTYTYIYGQQWYTTSSYKYWNGDWEAQFYAAGATSYRFIVLIAQTYQAAPHRFALCASSGWCCWCGHYLRVAAHLFAMDGPF